MRVAQGPYIQLILVYQLPVHFLLEELEQNKVIKSFHHINISNDF